MKKHSKPLPEDLKSEWMSTAEVEKAMSCSRCTVWRMIRDGRLIRRPGFYLNRVLISRASVKRLLKGK